MTVRADDGDGLERLARYLLRPPLSLERLTLEPGLARYRHKRAQERRGEPFDPAELLARLVMHIPAPRLHLVRYYGHYSHVSRARRRRAACEAAAEGEPASGAGSPEAVSLDDEVSRAERRRLRRQWAELIRRIYESDPLVCTCGAQMRLVSFITEPAVDRGASGRCSRPSPARTAQGDAFAALNRTVQPAPPGPSTVNVVLVVLALWNMAVAQPLYSVASGHPPFLSAHRAIATDLVWVAAALSLGLPLLLSLPVLALRRWWPRAARWALLVLSGLGGALLVVQLLPESSPLAVSLSVTCCGFALAATAYAYTAVGRRLLQLCAVGAVVFPALLLWQAGPRTSAEVWRKHLPDAAARTPRPVVVVLFDEWPLASILSGPESLDRVRFPNLAEFADAGVWFINATTVAGRTSLATPAVLTGRWPEDNRRPTEDHPANLFTLLATSMEFNVFEGPTDLCPEALCGDAARVSPARRRLDLLADLAAVGLHRIVPAQWAEGLPAIDLAWSNFWRTNQVAPGARPSTDRAVARFDTFLDSMADHPRETLHFAHVRVPHLPWMRLPTGQRYESAARYPHGLHNQLWRGSEWEMLQAWQRHLLQVGLVDTLMRRLDARLGELGLAEEALVVITSDHGTSFRQGRTRRNLNAESLTDILNVPLLVRRPGGPGSQEGLVDKRDASILDVLPTVLDHLGIEPPAGLAGRSLLGPPPHPGVRLAYPGISRGPERGPSLEYRSEDLDRGELVERATRWFGTGSWSRVFRLSVRTELLDRSPDPLLGNDPPLEVVMRQGRGLNKFRPGADVLPIHLAGRLPDWPAEEGSTDLAIAVHGVIVSTTRTFVDPSDGQSFTALLDPARLTPGDNELRIFVVTGNPKNPRLRATRLTTSRLRARRQRGQRE